MWVLVLSLSDASSGPLRDAFCYAYCAAFYTASEVSEGEAGGQQSERASLRLARGDGLLGGGGLCSGAMRCMLSVPRLLARCLL